MANEPKDPVEARKKLWDLIEDIEFSMLTTRDGDKLRSRPMVHKEFDESGALWFFTHAAAHKTFEVEQEQQVGLSYAAPNSHHYVSISGRASIVRDPARVKRLWSDLDKVWFPDGPDDPEIVFLKVMPEEAEYWDGVGTVGTALAYLRLKLTDSVPDPGENQKVRLAASR